MSHPLTNENNRKNIKDYLKRGNITGYFNLILEWEKGKLQSGSFYEEIQNIIEVRIEKGFNNDYPQWQSIIKIEIERCEMLNELQSMEESRTEEVYIKALNWLATCRDLKNPEIEKYFRLSGRDRETDVKNILYHEKKSKLGNYFLKETGRFYIPGYIRFFLRMYNLPAALTLICRSFHRVREPRQREAKDGYLPFVILVALISILAISYLALDSPVSIIQINNLIDAWPGPDLQKYSLTATWLALVYISGIALFVLLLLPQFRLLFRVLLPRLLAGIFAGYVALIFTEDVWLAAEKLADEPAMIVLCFFAVVFSYLFLLNEIRNTLQNNYKILIRSVTVLLIGLIEASIIGLALCDLFSIGIGTGLGGLPGIFGRVYPNFILLTAPLSLMIGIFVQIIWDDKPISEPF